VSQKITKETQDLRSQSDGIHAIRWIYLETIKQPGWLRGLEIVTGVLVLMFGVLVLIFPSFGVATLIILLSFGLIFAGIRAISLAGYSRLSKGLRVVSVIAGIISLILALMVLLFVGYGVLTLIIFVSYGLIVYGFSRIFLGYALKKAGWFRGLMTAVGVLDIILSVIVLALPGLALLTLAIILALVMLMSGAESIVSGIVGHT